MSSALTPDVKFYNIDINLITDNPQFLTGNQGNFFGLNQRYTNILVVIKNTIFFTPQEHLLGPTWFLPALFSSIILYAFTKHILLKICIKKYDIIIILAALLFASIGFKHVGINEFLFTYTAYTVFPIFLITNFIKSKYNLNQLSSSFTLLLISCCTLSFIICFLRKDLNFNIDLSNNNISYPSLFILESVLGFLFTYTLAYILTYNKILTNLFIFIGQYTMSILILHLTAFKIITYIQVKLYNLPPYRLSSFPPMIFHKAGGYYIVLLE